MTFHISKRILTVISIFAAIGLLGLLAACTDTTINPAQDKAIEKASSRTAYVPRNDIEFKNYNKRQQLADDPSAIIWCTSAFSTPGAPLFTVPIVGKLTSGDKRPFPTSQVREGTSYNPELPGSDAMYGHSGEYRYGFTPGDIYADWYGMEAFCTNEPLVWQKEATTIAMTSDPALLDAQNRASQVLRQGNNSEQAQQQAQQILQQAVTQAQPTGGRR